MLFGAWLPVGRPVPFQWTVPFSYLFDLTAGVTGDIEWCKKIDTSVIIPNRSPFRPHNTLRNLCIHSTAHSSLNEELCFHLDPQGVTAEVYQEYFESCLRNIRIKESPASIRDGTNPKDADTIVKIYEALGYNLPSTQRRDPLDVSFQIKDFIRNFNKATSYEELEAKKDFLMKVNQLPSYD